MERRDRRRIAALALALAALPSAIACVQLGRIHPDEVYQALEPAWWAAHGYGHLAWEWQAGLRNWALPGFLSIFVRLAAALGIEDPRGVRVVLALPQIALHAAELLAARAWARRRGASEAAATATMVALALWAQALVFAGRWQSEGISTALLVIACERLDRDRADARTALAGGIALGLAALVRYSSAILVGGAALLLLARAIRDPAARRPFGAMLAGLGCVAALLGGLDWIAWGVPFHSIAQWTSFNVLSTAAADRFGREAWWVYFPVLAVTLPAWTWIGLPLGFGIRGRSVSVSGTGPESESVPVTVPIGSFPLPIAAAVPYLVVLTLISHKETRFLYPAMELLALAGAPPLFAWLESRLTDPRRRALAFALVVAAGAAPWPVQRNLLVYRQDLRSAEFRAVVAATRPSIHGLLLVNEEPFAEPGTFYIGKNIPWTTATTPDQLQAVVADPSFDTAVTTDGAGVTPLQAAGFRVTDHIGNATILRR